MGKEKLSFGLNVKIAVNVPPLETLMAYSDADR